MESVGFVTQSEGSRLQIQVNSEYVYLGSILKIADYYGIVASMRYLEDDKVGSKQRLSANVQVFGKAKGKDIKALKRPIPPYEKVYRASDGELESILSCVDMISFGRVHGTNARALVDGGEYDRHTAVLASTGAGKSYLAANLIKEYSQKGLPILAVDTHGEFSPLLSNIRTDEPLDIKVYTVGKKRQGFDRFTIPVSTLTCSDFRHFTSLNENQVHALDMVLNKLFHLKGEQYSLDDVVVTCEELAEEASTGKAKVHEETAKALERRLKGLRGVFRDVFTVDGTDLNDLVQPYQITVIDTSLSTQGVRQAVVAYISKKLLDGRIAKKHSLEGQTVDYEVLFVLEEAHNYAGSNLEHSCKRQIARIASEGRKFGVGLVVVSQKPSKIDEDILSQCNTGMYMHITNPRDKDHIRRSFESVSDEIIRDLDSLDVGEAIITGAMVKLPFTVVTVDRIPTPEKKESKLNYRKGKKVKTGKFDYV